MTKSVDSSWNNTRNRATTINQRNGTKKKNKSNNTTVRPQTTKEATIRYKFPKATTTTTKSKSPNERQTQDNKKTPQLLSTVRSLPLNNSDDMDVSPITPLSPNYKKMKQNPKKQKEKEKEKEKEKGKQKGKGKRKENEDDDDDDDEEEEDEENKITPRSTWKPPAWYKLQLVDSTSFLEEKEAYRGDILLKNAEYREPVYTGQGVLFDPLPDRSKYNLLEDDLRPQKIRSRSTADLEMLAEMQNKQKPTLSELQGSGGRGGETVDSMDGGGGAGTEFRISLNGAGGSSGMESLDGGNGGGSGDDNNKEEKEEQELNRNSVTKNDEKENDEVKKANKNNNMDSNLASTDKGEDKEKEKKKKKSWIKTWSICK